LLGEGADSEASGRAKADVAKAAKGRATNPEAHRLYLQARHLLDRLNREDSAKAIEYLNQALQSDPEFAVAWAELGAAYTAQAGRGWAPRAEGFARARQSIQRALELEPDLAEAYVEQGWLQVTADWNFRDAAVSLAHAIELAPGNTTALRRAGVLAGNFGRAEEAIGLYLRAVEQDPLSTSAHNNLGIIFFELGRLEEAELALRKALELAPQRVNSRAVLALVLLAQSKNDEAIAEAQREPHEAFRPWALAIIHHALGHSAEADAALQELLAFGDDASFQIAEVYGARGEIDTAFEWLQRGFVTRDPGLGELKISIHLRSLHGDPRWDPWLKKMGLDG
jgi:tetratricopeptide (TPR) repeat protein